MIGQFHIYSVCSFLYFNQANIPIRTKLNQNEFQLSPSSVNACLVSPLFSTLLMQRQSVGWRRGRGGGHQRGLGEQAVDTLMDLSLASYNHSPGHSRTEGEREGETEEGRQRQEDEQRREKDRVGDERTGN